MFRIRPAKTARDLMFAAYKFTVYIVIGGASIQNGWSDSGWMVAVGFALVTFGIVGGVITWLAADPKKVALKQVSRYNDERC